MENPIKRLSSNPFQPDPARPISDLPNPTLHNPDLPNPTLHNPAQRRLSLYQPNTAQRSPLLYLITDRLAFLRSPEITYAGAAQLQLEAIGKAAQVGCQLIQIREKDMRALALGAFTGAAIRCARRHGARVLVNERID